MNKKEKKTKKKKNNEELLLKLGPVNKVLAFIVIFLVVFSILSILVGAFVKSYANFYWINIRNPIMGFFYSIFKYCPFIGLHFHIIGFILISILLLVLAILSDFDIIKNEKVLFRVFNICKSLIFIFLIPFIVVISATFSDKNNPRLNDKYFSFYNQKEYTLNDLIKLNEYYRDKLLLYAHKFERDEEGKVVFNGDVGEAAVNSIKKSSNKFNYLQGHLLDRFKTFSKREHKNNTNNTLGVSGAFGINYDPEFDAPSLISVLTHELWHTKGIARENEAVFCEVIANTEDDEEVAKYGGYLEGFNRVNYALYKIDFNTADRIEDEVLKYCLTDNYYEICSLYMKSINYYEKGTDHVVLTTYTLNMYDNYRDELFKALNVLVKDFDGKIDIYDNENVPLSEFSNYMDKTYHAHVTIEVNKEKFEKLQPYLKKYKNYFIAIRQESEDDEEPIERDGNESLEYYLAPFEGIDLFKSMSYEKGSFRDEYDYERVVRLFLEYYDTFGYN